MGCENPAGAGSGYAGKVETEGLFIVVTSDVMGREADIGRVLMKGFFETMKAMGALPKAIFFMNSAVRLTTTDEEFVPLLKGIQEAGVEIYSCGTCLKHYGLEERLGVGHRGSTGQVIEGIRDSRVVWI
ncbi:MAG: sulfurtransferase-like selenium metabolism protein YedF [Nitrospirota bacterium]|jgi:selenium metabolism protein YedF